MQEKNQKKQQQFSQFFARRKGRSLSKPQQLAMNELLPTLAYDLNEGFEDKAETLIFEFGFGKGEAILHRLDTDPDAYIIATEVYQNSLASFLCALPTQHRARVRLNSEDGFPFFDAMQDNKFDEIWLLNPDPWHKKRHHKRRFVQMDRLNKVASLLKPNGLFLATTDVSYLAEWTIEHVINHKAFEWRARDKSNWETAPDNWKQTSYETKGAKGSSKMVYLKFYQKPVYKKDRS